MIDAEVLHEAGLTPIPRWTSCPGRVWGRLLKGLPAQAALCVDIEGTPALLDAPTGDDPAASSEPPASDDRVPGIVLDDWMEALLETDGVDVPA